MNLKSIWSALAESFHAYNKPIGSAYKKMVDEKIVPSNWGDWGPLISLFPDELITFERYQRIFPYDSERAFHQSMPVAMLDGYLTSDSNGYRATEKGRETNLKGMQGFTDVLAPLQPMPPAELKRLADYLIRLSEATSAAPEPPSHFCHSAYKNYSRTFPSDAPLPRLFVHYFKELDFYRTDAHAAAWQIHNMEGNCWEAFTVVWRGEADTLDKFYEEYSDRGFTRDEYAQAFQELVSRGWIEENEGRYQTTVEGKRIREEAEALTDKYFFAPWSSLNESELEELFNLSTQLRDGLQTHKE